MRIFSSMQALHKALLFGFLLVVCLGFGVVTTNDVYGSSHLTCGITASPSSIIAGESTTITWTSNWGGRAGPGGSIVDTNTGNRYWGLASGAMGLRATVSPTETTTYNAIIEVEENEGVGASGGGTGSCSITIIVNDPPAPPAPTCTITASPSTLPAGGGNVNVSWSSNDVANDSTLWVLDTMYGSVGVNSGSGSYTVTRSGTIALDIWNGAGSNRCTASVTVAAAPDPAPTCNLSVSPSSLPPGGGSVNVSWSSNNVADDSTLWVLDNEYSSVGVNSGSGSYTVTRSGTIALDIWNAAGSYRCQRSVTVAAAPDPDPIYGCTDSLAVNYNPSADTNDGSCTYPPGSDPAPTCNLSVSPSSLPAGGGSVNVSWTSNNVADDSTLWVVNTMYSSVGVNSGSGNYTVTESGTIALDIWNAAGSYRCQRSVTVAGSPDPDPIYGCTDSSADNYSPSADTDDGSCTFSSDPDPVNGCTDPTANNYNPSADTNDGSCEFGSGSCSRTITVACPADALPDEVCTATENYDPGTCTSPANICGMTQSGQANCDGSCSIPRPSHSLCACYDGSLGDPANGVDNDGDGLVDFGNTFGTHDPGCSSISDTSENDHTFTTFTLDPEVVRPGDQATISWDVSSNVPNLCDLIGTNINGFGSNQYILRSSERSGSLTIDVTSESLYTLRCGTVTDSVQTQLVPTVFEI